MDSDVLDDGDSTFAGTGEADGISTVGAQNKTLDVHAQLALARGEVASLKEALLEKESTINCERQLKKTAVKKMTELKHSLRTTERLLKAETMRRKLFEVEGTSSRPVVSNGDEDIIPLTPVRRATALPIRSSSVRGGMSQFSEARAETYLNSSVNAFAQMRGKAAGFDPDKFFDSHNRTVEEFAASSDAALWMGYFFRFGVESNAALKNLHEQRKLMRSGSVDASWRKRTAEMLFNLLCEHNRDKIIVTVIDDLKVEWEHDLGDVLEEFFTALKMRVHEVELLMRFLRDLAVAWEGAVKNFPHPLNVCRAIREKIAVEFCAQFEFADEHKLRLHDQDDMMFEVLRCGVENNLVKLKDLLDYYLPRLTTEEYIRTAGGASHVVQFVDLVKFAHEAISDVRGEKEQLEALFEARMEELEFAADNFASSDADDDEVLEVIREVLEWHKTIASTDVMVTGKKVAKPENGAGLQSGYLEDDQETPSAHVDDSAGEEMAEKGSSLLSGDLAVDEKSPHNHRHHGHARKEKELPAHDHQMGDTVELSKDKEENGYSGKGEDLDEKGDAGPEDDEDHHSDEEVEGGQEPTEENQEDQKQSSEHEEQRNSKDRGKEGSEEDSEEDEVFHNDEEGSEDLVNKRQPRAQGGKEEKKLKDHKESKASKETEHHQVDDAEEDQEDGYEEDGEELEESENQGQQMADEIDKSGEESINNVHEKSGKDQQQPKETKEGEEIEDSNFGKTVFVENDFEKRGRVKQKGEPETKEGLDPEDNVDSQQTVEVQTDVEEDEEDNEEVVEEEDSEDVEEEEEGNKEVAEEGEDNEDTKEEEGDSKDAEEEEEDDPDVKKQEDDEDIKKLKDDEDVEEEELGDEDGEDENDDQSVKDREDDEEDDNQTDEDVQKKPVKKVDHNGEDKDQDHEGKLDARKVEKSRKFQEEESGSEESFDEEEEEEDEEEEDDSRHEAPQKRKESCSEDSESDEDDDDEDAQVEDESDTDEDDSARSGRESATPSSSSSTDSPLRNRRRGQQRTLQSPESDDDEDDGEDDDADEPDDRPKSRSGAGDSKIASQTCTARTKAGNPCKNKPQVGCVYCHVHRNLAQNAKK